MILESSAIFKTNFLQLGLSINGIPYPIRASFYILIDINITELFPFHEKNYCRMMIDKHSKFQVKLSDHGLILIKFKLHRNFH